MRTEKTLWIIFLSAFILKLFCIPGTSILIVASLSLLSMLYFPGAIYFFSDKDIKRQNTALSVISGSMLSLIPIGIMFKIQHYPGYKPLILIALLSAIAMFIATYILRNKANDDLRTYYHNMYLRTIILCITVIFFYFLPSRTICQIQHYDDPELVRLETRRIENMDNEQYRIEYQNYVKAKDSLAEVKYNKEKQNR